MFDVHESSLNFTLDLKCLVLLQRSSTMWILRAASLGVYELGALMGRRHVPDGGQGDVFTDREGSFMFSSNKGLLMSFLLHFVFSSP